MVLDEIKARKMKNLVKYSIYRCKKFRNSTMNTKLRFKHEFWGNTKRPYNLTSIIPLSLSFYLLLQLNWVLDISSYTFRVQVLPAFFAFPSYHILSKNSLPAQVTIVPCYPPPSLPLPPLSSSLTLELDQGKQLYEELPGKCSLPH